MIKSLKNYGDISNNAVYKADLDFYKRLKNYYFTKNQLNYFEEKHSKLSDGKKQELKTKIAKSITKFNSFAVKNNLGNVKDYIKNDFIDKAIENTSLFDKFDEEVANLEVKYASTLSNSSRFEKFRLKSIANKNYAKKYKNSYNRRRKMTDATQGYFFLSPAILLLSIFMIFSIGFGVYMSFHKVKTTGFGLSYTFVGLDQYKFIFKSESFKKSLIITLTYMAMVAPIQTILALVLSSLLAQKLKGKKLFTILYFLPTLTSSTALTLIFLRLFGSGGPMSNLLGGKFVEDHILGLVAIMNIWTSIPYFMTVYNAAHADVPKSQYEAASIDGASSFKKFIKITVPHLKNVTAFVLLTSVIWTLQTFDQLYIIGKDPTLSIRSEEITSTAKWIYDAAFGSFKHQDFGKAAAGSIVLAAIIFAVSIFSNIFAKGRRK